MKNYIELALKTETKDYEAISKRYTPEIARLMHASTGLCTETGELLDMLKYNKPFDKVNAIEELGDIFWYMAIACDALGVTFDEVMEKNIAKLKARYGEKFSNENAINRDLEKERDVLESEVKIVKENSNIVEYIKKVIQHYIEKNKCLREANDFLDGNQEIINLMKRNNVLIYELENIINNNK